MTDSLAVIVAEMRENAMLCVDHRNAAMMHGLADRIAALSASGVPEGQIRFDWRTGDDREWDSKVISHDEMRERYDNMHRMAHSLPLSASGVGDAMVERARFHGADKHPYYSPATSDEWRAILEVALAAAPKVSDPVAHLRGYCVDPSDRGGFLPEQADPAPSVADPGFDRDAEWCHANPYDAATHIRAIARIVAEKDAEKASVIAMLANVQQRAEEAADLSERRRQELHKILGERNAERKRADALAGVLRKAHKGLQDLIVNWRGCHVSYGTDFDDGVEAGYDGAASDVEAMLKELDSQTVPRPQ